MSVRQLFSDAQTSAHKSLASRMQHLEKSDGFQSDFLDCTLRLLGVPKSEIVCTRVIKFIAFYLSLSPCLTTPVLSTLLPYLSAKDKTVRFRSVQLSSHILNTISSIDDDIYVSIRHELIKRLHDKLPAIRVEAASVMSQFLDNESDHESNDDTPTLLEKVLDVLRNDSNAQVRRTLLLNLPLTPETLPYLFERARDRDDSVRRGVYTKVMTSLADFRHLSVSMREKILRWGLRDQDEKTRQAAARLFFEHWIEDCARLQDDAQAIEQPETLSDPSIPALLELLERIDVVNTGVENGIAVDAMKHFWQGRPDYLDAVHFDDDFWANLTPESAFMVRTFSQHCHQNPLHEATHEQEMPEITQFGFYLQQHLNALLECIRVSKEDSGREEDVSEKEFIVEQLLHIAQTLDYSDEVGRRRMFSLLRESMALAELPEEITRLIIEAFKLVVDGGQFANIILETIAEMHDMQDETGEDYGAKCLQIAADMLQNVEQGELPDNYLATTVENLIIPAVRAHGPVRLLGLRCLALACLLDEDLAKNNIELFKYCVEHAEGDLQDLAVQALSDIGITYDMASLDVNIREGTTASDILTKSIAKAVAFGTAIPAAAVEPSQLQTTGM
jgi:condensin complex subunit 3